MRNFLFALFALLNVAVAKADGKLSWSVSRYEIKRTSPDASLPKGMAAFEFKFMSRDSLMKNQRLNIHFGGNELSFITNAKGLFTTKVKPGNYQFKLSGVDYIDITTDTIPIAAGTKIEIEVHMTSNMVIVFKPVIYLYPEKETVIDLSLKIPGEFTFTYPEYKNGWSVVANEKGEITTGGKTYNYLFWEGKTNIANEIVKQEGFNIPKKDLMNFLEQSLSQLGLNTKEQQDFITYWYPQMMNEDETFIQFIYNENYNQYAGLEVSPSPDCAIRIFMLWSPSNERTKTFSQQQIPSLSRKGFTLVEWGGTKIEIPGL